MGAVPGNLADGADESCSLLGPLGLAVQAGITAVCAAAMLSVWWLEKPRRSFATWAFDISKQVVGAAYGKCYNLAQAELFARLLHVDPNHDDQCVWYLMGIATDCLVTTFLCWGANSLMRPILAERFDIDIGDYDGEVRVLPAETTIDSRLDSKGSDYRRLPDVGGLLRTGNVFAVPGTLRPWLVQVCIWLGIITAVRLFVTSGLFFTQAFQYNLYAGVFTMLNLNCASLKVVFAVLIFPAAGDTLQIIVQDHFLKKPKKNESAQSASGLADAL